MELKNFKSNTVLILLTSFIQDPKSALLKYFTILPPEDETSVDIYYGKAEAEILQDGVTSEASDILGLSATLKRQHYSQKARLKSDVIEKLPELESKDNEKTIKQGVALATSVIKSSLEKTLTHNLAQAMRGVVGTVDLFKSFEKKKNKQTFTYDSFKKEGGLMIFVSKVKELIGAVMEDNSLDFTGYTILLGSSAYSALESAPDTKKDIKYLDSVEGFVFRGVEFISSSALGKNEGLAIPKANIFFIKPLRGKSEINGDYPSTAVTTEILDHGMGVEVLGQNNYTSFCSTPDAVVHLELKATKAAPATKATPEQSND